MHKGRLKNWNDNKGYGFIESSDLKQDTFIHISTLKAMSRKPKVGDFIYFEVESQPNGKVRAVNCRIEGVAAKSLKRTRHNTQRRTTSFKSKIAILSMIGIAIFAFERLNKGIDTPSIHPIQNEQIQILPASEPTHFKCDGRQYCSQMNSRAEAEYFIRHCPNTKMDGDRDGIPCENDSRF